MNILDIIPSITAKSGGAVTTMENIIKIWQAAGHSVQVLTIDHEGATPLANVDVVRVPASFPARFSNSKAAIDWLAESYHKFDLVFVHSIWSIISVRACLFLRDKGHPYVMIPHSSLDAFDLQKKSLAKRFLGPRFIRPCVEESSAVLCSSQREADGLVTYGAKCNAVVLPWPLPPLTTTMERQDARQKLGLADDEFVVLSLGRVDYKKGFPMLLPAIQRLVKVNPKTRLLIVGPDSNGYLAVVQRLVKQLGLGLKVTFIPMVMGEEKLRVLRAADCFALPSLNENFGYVVVEAMRSGLPCVISNNVYICDAVERGGAGLVCEYDEQAVFVALRRLADSTELRAKMSAAAIQTAQIYEPDRLKDKYLAMLEQLAGKRK